ncbi:MAG TPA: hypothetical protein VKP69_21275 [Isosphaeraceae bacterium]|nr:hypothetical protein [Isosphaeraceae bacterium]
MHTVLLPFRFPGVADPQDPALADDGIVQEHPSDRIIAQMTARSRLQTFINVLYEDGTP